MCQDLKKDEVGEVKAGQKYAILPFLWKGLDRSQAESICAGQGEALTRHQWSRTAGRCPEKGVKNWGQREAQHKHKPQKGGIVCVNYMYFTDLNEDFATSKEVGLK